MAYFFTLQKRGKLKGFLSEIFAQLRVITMKYPEPGKKFIIFAHGRSGTGLLRSLINSHPDIYCDNEIFLKRKAIFPQRYLLNRSRIFGKKIYGHKAKIFQLDRQYHTKEKVKKIFLSAEYQIIYLRRKNFFRQALSAMIASQRQQWHDTRFSPLEGKKFVIDCEKLLRGMEWIENCEMREKEILEGLEYLYISYEDDLLHQKNHQKTMNKIFNYLGVPPFSVDTNYVKTTSENISDFIENYDEVVDAVKKTKYAFFLDD